MRQIKSNIAKQQTIRNEPYTTQAVTDYLNGNFQNAKNLYNNYDNLGIPQLPEEKP